MGLFAFRRLRERQQEASAIAAGAFPIVEVQDAAEAPESVPEKRVQARGRRQAKRQEAV